MVERGHQLITARDYRVNHDNMFSYSQLFTVPAWKYFDYM